jgi:hypothetical protein
MVQASVRFQRERGDGSALYMSMIGNRRGVQVTGSSKVQREVVWQEVGERGHGSLHA